MRFIVALTVLVACDSAENDALALAHTDLDCDDLQLDVVSQCGHNCFSAYQISGCSQTGLYDCFGGDVGCVREEYTSADSTIAIDGEPLVPDGPALCRSGVAEGQAFYGVDLNDPSSNAALRIIRNADLTFELVATDSTGASSPPLVRCAEVTLVPGDADALSGDATVDCVVDKWTVQGAVQFVGCN